MRIGALIGVLCVAELMTTCAGDADPPPTSNATRVEACREHSVAAKPSVTLDDIARELAHGAQLGDALERIGYPAAKAQSVYVQGPPDDAAIRDIIQDRLCTKAGDAGLEEVGLYRSGDEAWIVLATRTEQPKVEDSAAIAARVLELVNAAREEPRKCGRRRFAAAPPLTLSSSLTEAASIHAGDMARHGLLDHHGSDGSTPDERVSRVGYAWQAVGENIASGQPNADAAVAAWLESPEHCMNIMSRQFTEMGIAFALAPKANPSIYWAQVFAAPQ